MDSQLCVVWDSEDNDMARPTGVTKFVRDEAERNASEGPAGLARFPRWMTISFVLIIGLILYVGVLSDSSGHLVIPAIGSIFYVAAVIGTAARLAYIDRRRDDSRPHSGAPTGDRDRPNGVAG